MREQLDTQQQPGRSILHGWASVLILSSVLLVLGWSGSATAQTCTTSSPAVTGYPSSVHSGPGYSVPTITKFCELSSHSITAVEPGRGKSGRAYRPWAPCTNAWPKVVT